MKKLQGFTLSEILIALLVLGIIIAASVPSILNMSPNKNAIMMKKAYYTTETIIHSLINDPYYYPDMTANCINGEELYSSGTNNCYFGFDNTTNVNIPNTDITTTAQHKLKCLFASKLNIKEDLASVCDGSKNIVTTMDGMSWYLNGMPESGASTGTLSIDVDGTGKGINKFHVEGGTTCSTNVNEWTPKGCSNTAASTNREKKKFDRIQLTIDRTGKISIEQDLTNGTQNELIRIISGETKLIGGDDD